MKIPTIPALLLLGGLAIAGLTGCVERRITILTNPDGAEVIVNGKQMPRSPVTFSFEWYGDYDIVLRHVKEEIGPDGQKVRKVFYLHTHEKAKAPPSQWLGIDFFADILPTKFEDHKTWTFAIPELVNPTPGELVERGLELKDRNDQATGVRRVP